MVGEMQRGSGGVVFVEDGNIGYVLIQEVQPVEFREKVEEMFEEDDGQHYFVIHKDKLNLHVSKIQKIAPGTTTD